MVFGTIYIILENDNVVYVGETKNYRSRAQSHISSSKLEKYNAPIYQYIRYRGGWEKGGFRICPIYEVGYGGTKEQLRELETYLIKYYSKTYILLNKEISRYMYMWWTQNDNKNNLQYETIIK